MHLSIPWIKRNTFLQIKGLIGIQGRIPGGRSVFMTMFHIYYLVGVILLVAGISVFLRFICVVRDTEERVSVVWLKFHDQKCRSKTDTLQMRFSHKMRNSEQHKDVRPCIYMRIMYGPQSYLFNAKSFLERSFLETTLCNELSLVVTVMSMHH